MSSLVFSVDTETLGLRDEAPIIQIGICAFDVDAEPGTEVDSIQYLVKHHSYDNVEPYAAAMNAELLYALDEYRAGDQTEFGQVVKNAFAAGAMADWMQGVKIDFGCEDEKTVFAGKNFAAFDLVKLKRLPWWHNQNFNARHRSFDVGNLYWVTEDGNEIPNLKTCIERAGMTGEVEHTALADAKVVATLIQKWARR